MILALCPNPSVDTCVWVDDFSPGQVHRARREARFPGGKGVHVALAAAELGERAMVLGCWGGPTGAWVQEECRLRGVETAGPELSGWTRTCLTFISTSAYHDTELLGCGPTITDDDWRAYRASFHTLLPACACVAMSGSWPTGAPDSAYADLIADAQAAEKPVFLDCTGAQLRHALRLRPYAVHLNRDEAISAVGIADPADAARRLARDCDLAVVTDGARGTYLAAGKLCWHAHVEITNSGSAVGSGDCLLAGLAIGCVRGLSMPELLRLATACGAANCLRDALGMCDRRDVETLLPQVAIRALPD